jgi:magnesium transporter
MRDDAAAGIATLARTYLRTFPEEATRRLDDSSVEEIARIVRTEPVRYAVPVLERLSPNLAADVLTIMPPHAARDIASAMDPVPLAAILGWMDDAPRDVLLGGLDGGLGRELRQMTEYPEDTAGRLMDPRATVQARYRAAGSTACAVRALHAIF